MNACAYAADRPLDDGPHHAAPAAALPAAIDEAVEQATGRIAPLWPLKHSVAVNPFLGLSGERFVDADAVMAHAAGARLTMPRPFYVQALASGRISDADLTVALQRTDAAHGVPRSVAAFKQKLALDRPAPASAHPTVADLASRLTGRDWSAVVTERISFWAAGHFDDGQAAWALPARSQSAYVAWREEALIDRTPQVLGLAPFRRIVESLPQGAAGMIAEGVERLQLPQAALAAYFHRLLMSIGGWAGHARYRGWQAALRGRSDDTLQELLAVRLAWEVAILECCRGDAALADAWAGARPQLAEPARPDASMALDHVLQLAYELAWQRGLIKQLGQPAQPAAARRMSVQAAFCIDVRSEVFRRALESTSPEIDTLGFAGFFGMPIEWVPLGQEHGGAQCPVLLAPGFTVREGVRGELPAGQERLIGLRQLRRRAAGAWREFKMAAVSSFAFVETMGWSYAGKLLGDSFGLSRPVADPATAGIDPAVLPRLGPIIAQDSAAGRTSGLTPAARVQLAEGALKAMSLRTGLARLVLLAGHGATTVNNPYASGLHCGACGGHTGQANARVAASVLNDPKVRQALVARGMSIPAHTWFMGGLHDTTTDVLTLCDLDTVPASHAGDVAQLQQWLLQAGHFARVERAATLGLDHDRPIDAQVFARSRDWSQVRPEWGLAGCAAYIVAPRRRTAGIDLGGRAFLNTYDWRQDEGFAVLESIMTAPMVVGSWIALQYYGSTVDNRAFGSGNKVLHNVVGGLGVLEGNGGDLRQGLPWQSLHDGDQLMHEPLRLTVVIAAPTHAISEVIARHETVRDLVDNGWIHLFSIGDAHSAAADAPPAMRRYAGALQWEEAV